jgi:UDP-glucose 4-epimerase
MKSSNNSNTNKFLVTGGTGFIGKNLVKQLIQEGNYCKCLVRKNSAVNEIRSLGADLAYGDILKPDTLNAIVQDVKVVFHLAAQVGKWGISEDEFYTINVQGTRNLLEASLRAGVKQFIFCSTPGVQGKGYPQAQEKLPYNPPYVYERTKSKAEELVLEFFQKKFFPVTIVRPDFVYGPGDLRRLPLYRSIRDKKFYLVGNGKSVLHPTYIDDVIQGFKLLIDNPEAVGEIFNVAGPCPISVKEYVNTIAQVLNVKSSRLKIPKSFAMTAACFCEAVSSFSGKEPFISRSKIEFLTKSHGSDISKARSKIGYEPKFELQEGMQRTINWCYEQRLL